MALAAPLADGTSTSSAPERRERHERVAGQIRQIIETEPVAFFLTGTPEMPACGNLPGAQQALWNAGAPTEAVDILPDPRLFERGRICPADDRG